MAGVVRPAIYRFGAPSAYAEIDGMTPESRKIAELIDQCGEEIRKEMHAAVCRLLPVFKATVPHNVQRELPLSWARKETSNVIEVAAFQRKPAKRAPRRSASKTRRGEG